MIKRSLKNASYMFLSVMVAIALSITITYAAFTSKAVATGTITFETMYNIVVAKDGTTNLGAPTISFTNKLFDGSASAVISLSETSITATSLNDGTINGNFTKYAWQIAGSNLDSTNLHYSVYARTDYTYYPALKVVLQYNGSSSSIDGVHLSVKDAQSVGQMYDEEVGAYYSYNVIKDTKHYIVTFPMQSIVSGTTQMREIYIIQLDGTSALQVTGQGKTVKNYELVLNDIIDGIYFETDNKPTSVSLTTSFQVSKEPKY